MSTRKPALVMTCRCGEHMLLLRTTDGTRVRETWYCPRRRIWNFWKHAQLYFYVALPGKEAK